MKVKDIFSITKLLFMFDFINENVHEKLKTIFLFNRFIHSYETRSSMIFHIPKAKMSRFGLNTLRHDGANNWNKFYHALLSWQKQSLKNYFKYISWTLMLNELSSHFRLFCFGFFQFYWDYINEILKMKFSVASSSITLRHCTKHKVFH